jgi:hypothetical protein
VFRKFGEKKMKVKDMKKQLTAMMKAGHGDLVVVFTAPGLESAVGASEGKCEVAYCDDEGKVRAPKKNPHLLGSANVVRFR